MKYIYEKVCDHALKYITPSALDPVLLILRGHASHTKNVVFIEKASKKQTTLFLPNVPISCNHYMFFMPHEKYAGCDEKDGEFQC